MRRKFQQFITHPVHNLNSIVFSKIFLILNDDNSTFNVMVNEEVAIYWHIKTSKPAK